MEFRDVVDLGVLKEFIDILELGNVMELCYAVQIICHCVKDKRGTVSTDKHIKSSIGGTCSIVTVIRHCDQKIGGNTSPEKCPQAIIIIIIIIIIILFVEYKDCH